MIHTGDRVQQAKANGKTGTAITDEQPDAYGYGIQIVTVQWDTGRKSTSYAKNLRSLEA